MDLQETLSKTREEYRLNGGVPSSRSNTGPVVYPHTSDRSTESLNVSASSSSLNDLEGLSREQLIARCRREISMKQTTIEKLTTLATAKGIEQEHRGSRTAKGNKKAHGDVKREREKWEREHAVEMQRRNKRERELESEIDMLRNILQEEMNKNATRKSEEREIKRQLELFRQNVPPEVANCIANGVTNPVAKPKRKYR